MKFSFSTNAFRQYSLSKAAAAISHAGYSGIEIMCDKPHAYPQDISEADIAAIKDDLACNGLTIANLNTFMLCAIGDFHHPSWIEPDHDYRERRVQYTLDCIDLAAQLGVRTISTEPGGPMKSISREAALDLFMEELARAVTYAVEREVTILIEPEPELLIQTSHEFLSFMDRFGRRFGYEGLGLNFDVGHFYCVREDPAAKILELKDYIHHFHLEDIPESREHQHIQLGEGGVDIPGVLDAIDRIGYHGFVTIELYPYQDSAPETAQQARRYLQDIYGQSKKNAL